MFETSRFRRPTGSSRSRCEGHQRKAVLSASRIPGMAREEDQRQPPHLHEGRSRRPYLGAGSWRHGPETWPVPGFPSTRDRKLSFVRNQEDYWDVWRDPTVGAINRHGLHGVQPSHVEPAPALLPAAVHPITAGLSLSRESHFSLDTDDHVRLPASDLRREAAALFPCQHPGERPGSLAVDLVPGRQGLTVRTASESSSAIDETTGRRQSSLLNRPGSPGAVQSWSGGLW